MNMSHMSKVKQTQLSQVANIIKNLVKNKWNPNIQAKSSSSWDVPLVLNLCQGVPFCQSMMISLMQPGGERNIETEILLKSNKKILSCSKHLFITSITLADNDEWILLFLENTSKSLTPPSLMSLSRISATA